MSDASNPRSCLLERLTPRRRRSVPTRPAWAVWLAVAVMIGVPLLGQALLIAFGWKNNISWSMWSGQ